MNALNRARRPKTDNRIVGFIAIEKIGKKILIGENQRHNIFGSAKRVWVATSQHLLKIMSHCRQASTDIMPSCGSNIPS